MPSLGFATCMQYAFHLLAATLLLVLLASCQPTAVGPAATNTTQVEAIGIAGGGVSTIESGGRNLADQVVEETWDAYSMQGTPVGYAQTTVSKVLEQGRELVRTRQFMNLEFSRDGQPIRQQVTMTSWETPSGELVRFESQLAGGPSEMTTRGRVEGSELVMQTGTLGRTQTARIPWQAEWGGPFAVEQSLQRNPLHPGETRTVRGLTVLNMPGDTRLSARDDEEVLLPSGKTKLLRVDCVAELAGQRIEHVQWIDERGQTLKSFMPGVGQEAVRTTKQAALQSPRGKFDLMATSVVPVATPVAKDSQRVVYRARVKSGSVGGLFAEGLSQRVKNIDEQTAEITVLAVRPDQPAKPDMAEALPTAADREANSLVQSDDPLIVELAKAVVPRQTDAWKIACALEAFVDQRVQEKSLSQAFASATEVAVSGEGDCTEHAVLLAALCRARGIPARVAFGLVYYAPKKGFAYHMWTEAWIGDRWVPLDATLALCGIGADHIKLGVSNLAGGSPLADLLAVTQVFGRLQLEVVEQR